MILSLTRMRGGKGPALALLAALFVLLAFDAPVWAAQRVALVIGNSAYRKVPQLPNPVRDAKALAEKLRGLGFAVTTKTDLDYDGMRKAFRAFSRRAAGADVAVVFYAGHGMEAGGVNYLIPVDAELKNVSDLDFEAISLNKALKVTQGARKLRLVLLDACRNNPFVRKMKQYAGRTRSIGRGLARVEPEGGNVMVAYAARAGSTADDGDGEHSPFTEALLHHLGDPVDVRLMLGKVRDQVKAATNGRQEPFVNGSLGGETISLVPEQAGHPDNTGMSGMASGRVSVPEREDPEVAFQKAIADGTMEAYAKFLGNFPGSPHAGQVRKLMAKLSDDAAWSKARAKNTIAGYQGYLIAFPKGAYAAQARRKLASLQDASRVDRQGGMGGVQDAGRKPARRDCDRARGAWRVINIRWNDVLNIREGPGKEYGIIYGLPPDARGISLGQCMQRGPLVWCKVRYKCYSGWAARKYLARTAQGPRPDAGGRPANGYRVIGHTWPDMLNVRSGPGTQYPVTSRIPDNGINVRVFNCVSVPGYSWKWCRVDYRGNRGWAYAKYLADMRTGQRPR